MLGTCLLIVGSYVVGYVAVDLIERVFRPRRITATAELRFAPALVPVDLEVVHIVHDSASVAGGLDQLLGVGGRAAPSTTYTYAATPFDGEKVVARLSPLGGPGDVGPRTPANVGLLYTDSAGERWLVWCNEGPAVAV